MLALNRRQEDSIQTKAATRAQTETDKTSTSSQDNVVCWGDDTNAQLQVPGKETSAKCRIVFQSESEASAWSMIHVHLSYTVSK